MFYIVTGGSGSGKSEYAEKLAMDTGASFRIYLATMMVWDEEGGKRVRRHRSMRAEKGFKTVEWYTDLEQFKPDEEGGDRAEGTTILLECMSNLVSNEYYRLRAGIADISGVPSTAALSGVPSTADISDVILRGINRLQKKCENLIIVTNEVGSDGKAYNPETKEYIEILGIVNRSLCRAADSVTEVVYGIPIKIK